MDLSRAVLGESIVKYIRTRQERDVLRIGRDAYTCHALSRVQCFNFTAAANLSSLINSHFQVKDTADLFKRIGPVDLVLPRLGAVSLAVLGAAFELSNVGGEAPLEAWFQHHRNKGHTFGTIKAAAKREADQTPTPPRRTPRARRARATAARGTRAQKGIATV